MESLSSLEAARASVTRNDPSGETLSINGRYDVVCIGADGQEKWRDSVKNLVVTVGKNDLLDKYLAGSAYTAAWYLGLVDGGTTPTYAAGDTLASHSGWTENTAAYTSSNRWTVAWNAASSGSKGSTTTAVAITATATIAGCLLTVTQAKATTTGVLLSAGSFSGGNRSVINGDTLNITYTLTV
jgi:hypothetical protein